MVDERARYMGKKRGRSKSERSRTQNLNLGDHRKQYVGQVGQPGTKMVIVTWTSFERI